MRKMYKLFILLFFILFFSSPVVAQEDLKEVEEVVTLAEEPGEGVITGEVISLDASSGSISVKTDDGAEKTFSVIDGETILWKGIEDIGLSDVKKGETAEVGYYTDEGGNLIASWVDVLIEEEIALEEEVAPLVGAEEEKGSPKGSQEE